MPAPLLKVTGINHVALFVTNLERTDGTIGDRAKPNVPTRRLSCGVALRSRATNHHSP